MATTVSYSASMRTRKTNSASNAKSSAASQEYYESTYNYVGVVHFAGMALSGKVITGISLRVVAAQAGYGTGHTKTVYVRKSKAERRRRIEIFLHMLEEQKECLGFEPGTFVALVDKVIIQKDGRMKVCFRNGTKCKHLQ